MKSEKTKLVLALTCLGVIILINQVISWTFPDLTKQSPVLAIALFVILIIPVGISMSYLIGFLMRFIIQRTIDYDERQQALHLSPKQRICRNLFVWLILACGFGVLTGSFNLPKFWALSQRGVSTPGHELKTAENGTVGYEFKVGQKIYRYSVLRQSNENLYPGANVTIVYDPLNPQQSIVGPLKPMLDNELVTIGMIILVFPTIIMITFKRFVLPDWRRSLKTERS
jgi:hypothetical protein